MDKERLEQIKMGMNSNIQEEWVTWDDIEWLIETVEKQEIMINMHYQAEEEDEKTKQRLCDQIDFYIDALRDIDTHIRSTPEPVQYIINTLKKSLPEYKE